MVILVTPPFIGCGEATIDVLGEGASARCVEDKKRMYLFTYAGTEISKGLGLGYTR
jgi:hypothetical protein